MKKILILSHDKVGESMAGPGIRYHYIALELARHHEVTLGVYNPDNISGQITGLPYRSIHVDVHDFKSTFDEHDVIFALWMTDEMMEYARANGKVMVFDLYVPGPVESLIFKIYSNAPVASRDDTVFRDSVRNYQKFFQYGDFFVCSNERQLDFWYGYIFGSDLITPSGYSLDPIDKRIALAPMGISNIPVPERTPVLRQIEGIGAEDTVFVWTGGIWDWFDASSVIEAMALLKSEASIKLVFLGTKHPNKDVPEMSETARARRLSDELSLTGKSVFFLDGWIKYEERLRYLADADAAIYAHKSTLEARFSHRTRVLDHILMKLPTIATRGDYFADLVEREELGIAVPMGDAPEMARAMKALEDPVLRSRFRDNLARIQPKYYWETVLSPLVEFVEQASPKPALLVASSKSVLSSLSSQAHRLARRLPKPIKQAFKSVAAKIYR
ncbi:MAG TPA: glycosyltransferase family 4 protein [Anaerolineales bacterium]|nr:glycosyltransferase family 4 protein [Anaerolineales bacterium]